MHEGGFGVAVTDDGLFVFTRPDGSRIPDCGTAPKPGETGRFRGIVVAHAPPKANVGGRFREIVDPDSKIDAQTARCKWFGEWMDYSTAIESMQFREEAARAATAAPS